MVLFGGSIHGYQREQNDLLGFFVCISSCVDACIDFVLLLYTSTVLLRDLFQFTVL